MVVMLECPLDTRHGVFGIRTLEACPREVESDQASVAQTLHIFLVSSNGLECTTRPLSQSREGAPLADHPAVKCSQVLKQGQKGLKERDRTVG